MTNYETFPNAPIVEAILDITIDPPEGLAIDALQEFPDNIKQRFIKPIMKRRLQAQFKLGGEITASPIKDDVIGYLIHSEDEQRVLHSRFDGFAFSKLKPYESWDSFKSEARELWEHYKEITHPSQIVRTSLRYVNRIMLPGPRVNYDDYILTNPQIAPDLPQGISNFLIRLEIPEISINGLAVVIVTIEAPKDQKKLPLIFDIDVISQNEYSISNTEQMWTDFEALRGFKNEIFFQSTTEKAKDLFR